MTFVTHLGRIGSYSYFAAKKVFGETATYIETDSPEELFKNIKSGKARFGVLPVENSTTGVIEKHLQLFNQSKHSLKEELWFSIEHNLLGVTSDINQIKKVYAHPQSFAQCKRFLSELNNVELIEYADNGSAAKFVSLEARPELAAIASAETAQLFWLTIIAQNISDEEQNQTRFLVFEAQV